MVEGDVGSCAGGGGGELSAHVLNGDFSLDQTNTNRKELVERPRETMRVI